MWIEETINGYIIRIPQETLIENKIYDDFMSEVQHLQDTCKYKLKWKEYSYNPEQFMYKVFLEKEV